jgi:site-specific DNA recombinase
VDRLGRGDMIDQGTILRAFKSSKTKIITPNKVYDLEDEWDEEYTEFEAFMARRELKMITKRMQRGRVQSVKDGNYIGTNPPYGYKINKTDRERILVPNPEQAPVVKMIYEWYTHEIPEKRMGSRKIANELNRLGYTSATGRSWTNSSVLNIIKNAVYAGRLQWKKREQKKSAEPGKIRDTRTRPQEEWIDVEGKHEPLISMETYKKAQDILQRKYHVPYQLENGITNPLAGLIRCDMCGASMVQRPYTKQKPHLICYSRSCSNKSSRFEYVENRMIEVLQQWLDNYKLEWDKRKKPEDKSDNEQNLKQTALKQLERELIEIENQKSRLHDFLERGIYDEQTYLDRSQNLAERMEKIRKAILETEKILAINSKREKAQKDIIPQVENALELYHQTHNPAARNNLLKSILEKATYRKEQHQREDDFTLILYPKLDQ